MELSPYLIFNGNCAEAFKLYEKVLGGKIVFMQTHGESPMKDQVAPDMRDKVIHVRLERDGHALMGSDAPAEHYVKPQGTSVSVTAASTAEGERIFNAFAEGATVTMPFQQTFWSPGFGMLIDRFGTSWMINTNPA